MIVLKHSVLQTGQEEMLLWHPQAWPHPSVYVMASNEVIPVHCESVISEQLKSDQLGGVSACENGANDGMPAGQNRKDHR
jgi:hypothetical protein